MRKQILVTCRTGMGSSMILKIKIEQVLTTLGLDADVYHDVITAITGYNDIDILVTMADLKEEMQGRFPIVIGIESLMDKEEISSKLYQAIKNKY
ncbi:MAG: PTS sugar transporter subunit IIB [Brevinema sp.]